MKIKLLMAGLLGLVSATTFAQKGELSTAKSEYDNYEGLRGAKATLAVAVKSLGTAKTSIDKAAANEKTSALPQTFALKGAIYAALATQDTVAATSLPLFTTADESLKKAKELDTKGENKQVIDNAYLNLAQYQLTKGVAEYGAQKYDQAYHSFDYYRTVLPEDTNAIYYTGLAAANSKNYPAAITNYNKLVTTKYSKNAGVYMDLSSLYLANKDTTNALKSVSEGITKYPSNTDLRKREIEISLQTGKEKEVIQKIQAALTADPKNKTLYYYAGLTYSQTAEAIIKEQAKAKDAAAKNTLQQQKVENYDKAAEMYKKALEIDPNYFEANLNLGYVILNPAIDAYNAANKLPANKQKEYDAAIAKANAQFDLAKPYLVKAADLNPKSVDALTNLRTYYLGKKDNVNAEATKKKIDALSGQ
ncbi:Tetratricopeptide repeat-containing protein [Mucilaginibacter lappiensis]|uniref:Tetratricopeptide (TPR) repeat protein n=1 Tax=Mucilaginibacter lappiensis TaxID=354630 RepID=A0ABR6PIV4_9SPHI|nr:tetratricopeptide repeat protein [Mucilaginibacter lappiensis]MBB6109566.1 tetratricopeptide (TPR) repeat protein [Mucilaginibacter lappiensis]SIQ90431.1 Tetratricopeptide repeat-containing protein [Mucilaginibacter lappiensis]